jgi:Mg-dependent DNase
MATRGIDTHAHLFLEAFGQDIEAVTHRAQAVCEAVLLPNLDAHTLPALRALIQRFPGFYHGMLGLHPTHVREDFLEQLTELRSALNQGRWIAIGEVGLDAYHDASTLPRQREALSIQVAWARETGLPLSIHFRAALDETLEVLMPFRGEVTGVFHCFTGSREEAFRILNAGFVVGLGGGSDFQECVGAA